jgi:DNA-binding transcriptional MerR regulator
MRIGELAERARVSVRSLRYYEERGLVPADRNAGGQRQYPESAVGRVKCIQVLYAAGLGSKAIRIILPFVDTGVVTPEMTRRLADERDRIQAQIDDLARARGQLDELIRFITGQEASPSAPA